MTLRTFGGHESARKRGKTIGGAGGTDGNDESMLSMALRRACRHGGEHMITPLLRGWRPGTARPGDEEVDGTAVLGALPVARRPPRSIPRSDLRSPQAERKKKNPLRRQYPPRGLAEHTKR
ncbi:hypothetical protein [Streptomyces sp. Inha503]|uniref:hypothetical protein n=1 Tax=Streptomyces sp. Inha503 TaxID=3383314 RepID=UPI0039A3E6BA